MRIKPAIKTQKELLFLDILALLLIFIISLGGPQFLRVALGLPFVLFIPGYCLIAALFPRQKDLDGVERVALSFGLSIAVVPLIGLALNYTPWGIRLYPILVSLSLFVLVMSALGLYRRLRLPEEERLTIAWELNLPDWRATSPLDRVLAVLLASAVLFALGSLIYVIVTPKVGERFTEFYILGPGGMAEGYPRDLILGQSGQVILGIVNHESAKVEYRVEVRQGDDILEKLGSLTLGNGEKWEEPLTFAPSLSGQDQKIEFLLYKIQEERQPGVPYPNKPPEQPPVDQPYRELNLWVNVAQPGTAEPSAGGNKTP